MTRNTESTDERIDTAPVDDEVSADVATEPADDDAPEAPAEETADAPVEQISPSAASAADLDDGTPESDYDPESDASEADETDEVATATPVEPPATASAVADRRETTAGAVSHDGSPHRRRRNDPPPAAPVAAPRRRGRAGWIAASIVLFLLLGAAVALDVHLWRTTDQWEARADDLTEINYALGEELSSEQSTTMQLESEIDLLSQQLATSNQKVVDLSAEKASANDASAFANQQIEELTGFLSQATAVASSMQRCIDGQEQLAEYLTEPDNYEPDQLAEYARGVSQLCDSARANNEALRAEMAG